MLAKIIFELAVELKNELNIHIAFINLSGGVGVPYEPDEFECDIMAIGEGVRRVYEEVLTPAGMAMLPSLPKWDALCWLPTAH